MFVSTNISTKLLKMSISPKKFKQDNTVGLKTLKYQYQ